MHNMKLSGNKVNQKEPRRENGVTTRSALWKCEAVTLDSEPSPSEGK